MWRGLSESPPALRQRARARNEWSGARRRRTESGAGLRSCLSRVARRLRLSWLRSAKAGAVVCSYAPPPHTPPILGVRSSTCNRVPLNARVSLSPHKCFSLRTTMSMGDGWVVLPDSVSLSAQRWVPDVFLLFHGPEEIPEDAADFLHAYPLTVLSSETNLTLPSAPSAAPSRAL